MVKRVLAFSIMWFLPVAEALAQRDTSRYVTVNLQITMLERRRDVQIFLPAGYYTSNKRYPVLYMQDAQNIYTKDVKAKKGTWAVDSVLRNMPPDQQAIIVGINHGGNNRIAEYSPFKSSYAKGDGPLYLDFVVNDLKPYIDKHYRTRSDARHTAIAGSSMGGLIALFAAVEYPKIFGTAGAFSPALWINPETEPYMAASKTLSKSRLWFACGDLEGNEQDYVKKMDSILLSNKVTRERMPPPLILKGEEHNERQWRVGISYFLPMVGKRLENS